MKNPKKRKDKQKQFCAKANQIQIRVKAVFVACKFEARKLAEKSESARLGFFGVREKLARLADNQAVNF